MKFTPASRAEATMRPASAASVRSPNIIVPRQSGETLRLLAPSFTYSMLATPQCFDQVQARADPGEVERDFRRFVGRVVVLVIGRERHDDRRQSQQAREDEVGRGAAD